VEVPLVLIDELLCPDPDDPPRPPEDIASEVLGKATEHRRTYFRHIVNGVHVGGRLVKLRAIRTGVRFVTTKRAFLAYLAELNNSPSSPSPDAGTRSPAKRRRASEAAKKQLEEQGVA
jgi:hypothetical protein